MKFYSEKTKEFYNSEKDCLAAEKKLEEKALAEKAKDAERKTDAEKVRKAFATYEAAGKNYKEVLNEFIKKYGSYHATYKDADLASPLFSTVEDFIRSMFSF